jgi:quercetin dioxygenase-like cupin family protein
MAQPGDELHNPKTGQHLIFRRTTAETGGEILEVESVYPPGSDEPIPHFHPNQTEEFEILAGQVGVRIDGEERRLSPGERLTIAPGQVHTFWNARDDEEARVVWRTIPALKTETFFETLWGLARDGRTNAKGAPGLQQFAVLAQEYDDEFRLPRPSRAIQKLVFGVVAPIARRRGYRARYPQYSGD